MIDSNLQLDVLSEWRSIIGHAIVGFGELELITYKCLVHIPSDKIFETTSRLGFSQRIDLILEILEARMPISGYVSQFIGKLKRAKVLASTRNHIAHNPVMLNMFVHKTSGDVTLERSIATIRGEKFIDLASAKEFAAEVEDLASTMWLLVGKIAEEDPQRWVD